MHLSIDTSTPYSYRTCTCNLNCIVSIIDHNCLNCPKFLKLILELPPPPIKEPASSTAETFMFLWMDGLHIQLLDFWLPL